MAMEQNSVLSDAKLDRELCNWIILSLDHELYNFVISMSEIGKHFDSCLLF